MRLKQALLPILAILLGIVTWQAALRIRARAGEQAPAGAAPPFSSVRFSDGRPVALSDFRGKVLLLYFFFPT